MNEITTIFYHFLGSNDQTVRLWDLAAGKSMCTLTHHKKSVRAVVLHPKKYMFASASPDNIKEWKCPEGKFIQNLSGHNAIVNCMAANADDVLVSGADNGTMHFWDWKTGYNFQRLQVKYLKNIFQSSYILRGPQKYDEISEVVLKLLIWRFLKFSGLLRIYGI